MKTFTSRFTQDDGSKGAEIKFVKFYNGYTVTKSQFDAVQKVRLLRRSVKNKSISLKK